MGDWENIGYDMAALGDRESSHVASSAEVTR